MTATQTVVQATRTSLALLEMMVEEGIPLSKDCMPIKELRDALHGYDEGKCSACGVGMKPDGVVHCNWCGRAIKRKEATR